MRCASCGFENPVGRKFCSECGTGLPRGCPQCGAGNAPSAKFCGECGAQLNAPARTPVPEASTVQPRDIAGERRHLTVLFCDLVGSTEIAAQLDPEEWHEIAARYQQAAGAAVTRFGGHIAQYLGDGMMAYFGWPEAHDNDAERAARAGLAILESMAVLNDQLASEQSPRLAVRIGIHSGSGVMAGRADKTLAYGDTPNIASRVQSAAEPDTVIVSAASHRLISGLFLVEERGPHRLKGIDQPMELYRIVRLSGVRGRLAASAGRGLTPFVGREDEMRLLWNRWERSSESEGQLVLIVGEGGIGKSRLMEQFRERLAGKSYTWSECAGAPYFQNTPFYPVADLLRKGFAGRGDESDEEKLIELERTLELAGLNLAEAVPLIAPLVNVAVGEKYTPLLLSAEQQRKRLLATLAGWVFGASRAQPLVVVIEDLHWVDPSTLELVQVVAEQSATARLMLLLTARPEFRPPWTPRAHHSQLTLNRLSARDVREMVVQVVANSALSGEAVDQVIERTGGVPLFVEELTRAVLEKGDAKPTPHEIPATLHDSLMARLDRLGPAKEVAQIASVIGREFSYELLSAISAIPEGDLQSALAKLADAEIIYTRGIPPEATYSFKHALIQDTAYEALLKSRRRELHRAVAKTIEGEFRGVADERSEMLARHWAGAGESERAITAWQKAGEQARARGAFVEAEEAYRQALLILNTLPESPERDVRELALMSPFVHVLAVTKAYGAPEMVEGTVRARSLAEKSGNVAELLRQVFAAWTSAQASGDYRVGGALADQLLDLAKSERSPGHLGLAHMAQVSTRFYRGDLAGSEYYFALGSGFFDAPGFKQYPGAVANVFGSASWCAWIMGRPDVGRERSRRAFSAANDNNNPYDLAFAQWKIADLHLYLREPEQAQALAAESVRLSDQHRFPFLAALSRAVLGRARAQLGQADHGTALIREGLAGVAKVGTRLGICRYLTYLAEAQALDGDIIGALATLEESLQANPAELVERPQTLRCRGQLHYKQGQTDLAEADLREAITLAHGMGAKAWELRATMSLAQLLDRQGKRDEARAMLAEIYGWFTEGFDTADLRDAKSLLEELSGVPSARAR
jgi:class 3 adenylate cyclase/tetratricopeptide (TPR) repeat protein